jgi:hypothetical protein
MGRKQDNCLRKKDIVTGKDIYLICAEERKKTTVYMETDGFINCGPEGLFWKAK